MTWDEAAASDKTLTFDIDGGSVPIRYLTGGLFLLGHHPGSSVRISVPISQITTNLGDLICSLPKEVDLEIVLTGLSAAYRNAPAHRPILDRPD